MKDCFRNIARAVIGAGLFSSCSIIGLSGSDVNDGPLYAIVVSEKNLAEPEWAAVVAALEAKHNGTVIKWSDSVFDAKEALVAYFPDYVCYVATPEESNRQFVADVHRLSRQLDDDPYTDAVWAILTGYEAADALRIAQHGEPLVARRALAPTVGAQLGPFDEGIMFNELQANRMGEKKAGGECVEKECPTDTTFLIVDALNEYQPDVFITSGHATERNWMIGFGYRNGFFLCEDGQIYGRDTNTERKDVVSPNPKIHLAIGNCLFGNIPDRNCMALAMMHSAGVNQLLGYTVPTGNGYGGWGVKDYFSELQAGRFTLAEANYANNLALVYELEKSGKNMDVVPLGGGMVGDRDVVVLYGDPAWEARMPKRKLPWTQTLEEDDGVWTFTVTANERGDWDNRPIVHLFPERLANIEVIEAVDLNPVIMDNFILLKMDDRIEPMKANRGETIPIRGDYDVGDKWIVKFRATPVIGT